mgnify:CR=1 FL=1|jgi:trk system potassium uptake protein TrkA
MQVAVIGLGSFGTATAEAFIENGHEVIVIDSKEERVERFSSSVVEPIVGDATNELLLKKIGPEQLDVVVVAIGDDVEASVLTCMTLLDLGAKRIVAKAEDDKHGKILKRIGVHRVVQPEQESARHVVDLITHPAFRELRTVGDSHVILEVPAPKSFLAKTLKDLNLRTRHGALVLAVRRPDPGGGTSSELLAPPDPDDFITEGDSLLIMVPVERMKEVEAWH